MLFTARPGYSVEIIEPAPAEPLITVAEAKANSRLLGDREDAVVRQKIRQATAEAEEYTERLFAPQTLAFAFEGWTSLFPVPRAPARLIGVEYDGPLGPVELAASSYVTTHQGEWLYVARSRAMEWPALGVDGRVRVVADCGYTTREEIPEQAAGAILARVNELLEDRSSASPSARFYDALRSMRFPWLA